MNGNTEATWFWTIVLLVFSFAVILFINLWSRHTDARADVLSHGQVREQHIVLEQKRRGASWRWVPPTVS